MGDPDKALLLSFLMTKVVTPGGACFLRPFCFCCSGQGPLARLPCSRAKPTSTPFWNCANVFWQKIYVKSISVGQHFLSSEKGYNLLAFVCLNLMRFYAHRHVCLFVCLFVCFCCFFCFFCFFLSRCSEWKNGEYPSHRSPSLLLLLLALYRCFPFLWPLFWPGRSLGCLRVVEGRHTYGVEVYQSSFTFFF